MCQIVLIVDIFLQNHKEKKVKANQSPKSLFIDLGRLLFGLDVLIHWYQECVSACDRTDLHNPHNLDSSKIALASKRLGGDESVLNVPISGFDVLYTLYNFVRDNRSVLGLTKFDICCFLDKLEDVDRKERDYRRKIGGSVRPQAPQARHRFFAALACGEIAESDLTQ